MRTKSETIEIGDTLCFESGEKLNVVSSSTIDFELSDGELYSSFRLYVGVDIGKLKIIKGGAE